MPKLLFALMLVIILKLETNLAYLSKCGLTNCLNDGKLRLNSFIT